VSWPPQAAALATEIQPLATQMALPTDMEALATQFSTSPEDAPPDIPIIEGEKGAFIVSPQAVSYFVAASFQEALAFYQREMPTNGWTLVEASTRIQETDAELHYMKDGRQAIVILAAIPFFDQTTVVVSFP
jgi:hypothetical protein